jgi:transcriptional regulator GlxA family with amidase domain
MVLSETTTPCPNRASRLFVDSIARAVAIHVGATYGASSIRRTRVASGLSSRELRAVFEQIEETLDGEISVTDLADCCQLSPSRLAAAFKRTTSVPTYKWLARRRVEKAKTFMREGRASLSQVALGCGFADQRHFTHVFTREAGVSPGEWRRESAPPSDSAGSCHAGCKFRQDCFIARSRLARWCERSAGRAAAPCAEAESLVR